PKNLHHIINSLRVNRRKTRFLSGSAPKANTEASASTSSWLLLWRHIPRLRLYLLQYTLAPSTARLSRVDTLRVTSVVLRAIDASPHVFVVDLVAVLGGDFNT